MRVITNVFSLFWIRSREIRLLLVLLLSVAGISSTAMATPADLDPTFDSDGIVLSQPTGTQSNSAYAIALQADGKIIMAGSSTGLGFVIARYNANGSLDLTFGGGDGWTAVTFGYTNETAISVAIQADGKIVAGGTVSSNVNDWGITRLNQDGSLDTGFDGDGKVIVPFNEFNGFQYKEYLSSVKIAPDGKIVAAGHALDNGPFLGKYLLARLNTDGSTDTNFGTGGTVISNTIVQFDFLNDMIVLPDGAIVVAGQSNGVSFYSHIVRKYNAAGGTEWTYLQSYPGGGGISALKAVAAQPDGKIVAAGDKNSKVFTLRLNADGSADNSFTSAPAMPTGEVLSAAIQTDGKIVGVVNAAIFGGSNAKFSVVRYNPDGTLDTGFNVTGIVNTTVIAGADHDGSDILIQPDGKILIGGTLNQSPAHYFAMLRYMGGSLVGTKRLFDFDGDGKADLGVFRGSNGTWYLQRSSAGELIQNFGLSGDRVAAADYDNDFKTDLAIYRNGDWWYLNSSNGTVGLRSWGTASDTPLPSDFDADGKADFIYYRPSTGQWFRSGSTGATSTIQFGIGGDIPLIADLDGDGKTDPTIFRPSSGTWWYKSSVTGLDTAIQWGQNGDVPVPGDYDADGKTDTAIFRPSNGVWYILNSGGAYTATSWGLDGDKPVAADYDGDGKTDIAVWRPSTGVWYILQSTAGFTGMQYGLITDKPVENAFLP